MGVAFHDGPVHECPRVAFVAVAYNVLDVIFGGQGQSPFASGGEPSASASPETGIFHDLADFFRLHGGPGFFGAFVSAAGDVFADAGRFDRAVGQNDAVLPFVERDVMVAAIVFFRQWDSGKGDVRRLPP